MPNKTLLVLVGVAVFLVWRRHICAGSRLGSGASQMVRSDKEEVQQQFADRFVTTLTSGRTKTGCHTAIGEDRVSCGTIKPRNSKNPITPPTEKFAILPVDPTKGTFAILSQASGKLCADDNGKLQCTRTALGPWETFTAERVSANEVAIKGYRLDKSGGRYCADDGINVNCNRTSIGGWETFTASNPNAFFNRSELPPYRPPLPALPSDQMHVMVMSPYTRLGDKPLVVSVPPEFTSKTVVIDVSPVAPPSRLDKPPRFFTVTFKHPEGSTSTSLLTGKVAAQPKDVWVRAIFPPSPKPRE